MLFETAAAGRVHMPAPAHMLPFTTLHMGTLQSSPPQPEVQLHHKSNVLAVNPAVPPFKHGGLRVGTLQKGPPTTPLGS
jgi:hypothetical protein